MPKMYLIKNHNDPKSRRRLMKPDDIIKSASAFQAHPAVRFTATRAWHHAGEYDIAALQELTYYRTAWVFAAYNRTCVPDDVGLLIRVYPVTHWLDRWLDGHITFQDIQQLLDVGVPAEITRPATGHEIARFMQISQVEQDAKLRRLLPYKLGAQAYKSKSGAINIDVFAEFMNGARVIVEVGRLTKKYLDAQASEIEARATVQAMTPEPEKLKPWSLQDAVTTYDAFSVAAGTSNIKAAWRPVWQPDTTNTENK